VRRYFPVDKVVAGVLGVYQQIFGLRFTETGRTDVWAPGVREFSVADAATGAQLGWFYLDLFPRRNKYSHFATMSVRAHLVDANGHVTKPIAAVVGNWPQPSAAAPSLLSHSDVVTFFHEFGHAMADILDESPYAGTAQLRQDFVEAPAQALEFWAWNPEVIRRVSADYVTGKPMPDSLLARMLALKHFDEGLSWTGQVMLASFDMALHTAPAGVNIDSTWAALKGRLTVVPWVPGTSPAASFVHLMSGYDAGYYGYLWSRVYAADIFSRFDREGVLNPAVGMAYRRDVLEPGGTVEPDAAVRRFLGRPVSDSAFLHDIGASSSSTRRPTGGD
ncbi:MAG TPA: M3 family metallopeptidase, partial [Gemmatimonadaceae bacterium]|nr:M3 family metallopeptidase [Gemmatimonadaceae bacterium]